MNPYGKTSPNNRTKVFFRDITEDYPHVYEVIESISDDLLNILSEETNTFIYGGLVRDIVAGMDLVGDIDVVSYDIKKISRKIMSSERWAPHNNEKREEMIDRYQHERKDPLLSIKSFINTYGYELQLVRYGSKNPDLQNTVEKFLLSKSSEEINESTTRKRNTDVIDMIAKRMDLKCCCMMMSPDGRVIEAVEGAEEDCVNRILSINPMCEQELNIERVEERVKKLSERGWVVSEELEAFIEIKKRENKNKKPEGKDLVKESGYSKRDINCIKEINIALGNKEIEEVEISCGGCGRKTSITESLKKAVTQHDLKNGEMLYLTLNNLKLRLYNDSHVQIPRCWGCGRTFRYIESIGDIVVTVLCNLCGNFRDQRIISRHHLKYLGRRDIYHIAVKLGRECPCTKYINYDDVQYMKNTNYSNKGFGDSGIVGTSPGDYIKSFLNEINDGG